MTVDSGRTLLSESERSRQLHYNDRAAGWSAITRSTLDPFAVSVLWTPLSECLSLRAIRQLRRGPRLVPLRRSDVTPALHCSVRHDSL